MIKAHIARLVLVALGLLLPAGLQLRAQTPSPPTNIQVTKQAGNQFQVCWSSVPGATSYDIARSTFFPTDEVWHLDTTAGGTICTTLWLYDAPGITANACAAETFRVLSNNTYYSPRYTVLYNTAFDDSTAPAPLCNTTLFPTAWLYPTTNLTVTDVSTSSAATLKINLTCPSSVPTGYTRDHYEIYERIRNVDGTTTTRTTTQNTCPNNKTLSGAFGQRVTISTAVIYSTGSGQNKTYGTSHCSNPVTATYGGIAASTPTLTVPATANASTITITGSIPTTSSINVLLFVNPTLFNQSSPTQTITTFTQVGPNKTFSATIPLNNSLNTIYAVTRTGTGTSTRYSVPSPGYFVKNYTPPLSAPTLTSLPAYLVKGYLYLAGSVANGARINVVPTAPNGTTLPTITGDACNTGTYGVTLPLAGLAAGAYTFRVSTPDGGSIGENTGIVHLNELYPSPTIVLDGGVPPIYVRTNPAYLTGSLTPTDAPSNAFEYFTLTGTVSTQTLTRQQGGGTFSLGPYTLSPGPNTLSMTAVYNLTGQAAPPINSTITFDNTTPTATAVLTTQIPNPTNQATWTLNGTITGFQGTVENAQVVLSGAPTASFPVAADGTWTGTYTFPEGPNSITFKVSDRAGNLGPVSATYPVNVVSQGMRAVFNNPGGSCSASEGPWPATLDNVCQQTLSFSSENSIPLTGSRLDLFLDEDGRRPSGSPPSCPRDDLTCLVTRKSTPAMTITFTSGTALRTLPPLRTGLHTIRMVLTDPFGTVTERGGVVLVGPNSGWAVNGKEGMAQPLANFAVPGAITTQTPKIVGRSGDAAESLDCNDLTGGAAPIVQYYKSQGGGSWNDLPLLTSTKANGIYEIIPNYAAISGGQLPLTNTGSGQVLRLSISQAIAPYPNIPPYTVYGRKVCSATGTSLSEGMYQYGVFFGGNNGTFIYDLPYRAPQTGDPVAPQIDTSTTTTTFATNDEPFSTRIKFRVTDLNADLNYRSVTITPPGCSDSSCVITARLDGEQQLTTSTPGGWYSATVNLDVGQNTFVITASDDANHTTTANLVLTRTLFHVIAKISSPANEGQTYYFCSPKAITFDASNSINQTDPPVPLRYQWTTPGFQLVSTEASFTQTITGADSRRVIVSSSAISAPNPALFDPCSSAAPGECSVASVSLQPFSVPTGTLPAQIVSPSNGASVRMDLPVTLDGTVGQNADPSYVYRWRLKRTSDGVFFTIPQSTGTGSDPSYAATNRTLTLRLDSISGVTAGGYTLYFDAAYQTTPGNCIAQQTTSSIGITVTAKVYTATGVAPGTTLPGGTATRLYGSGFDAAAQIAISGPVYSLTDTTTPLCTMPACPQVVVPATVGGNGTTLDFTTPVSLSPGYYLVFASDPATGAASSAIWMEVQPAQTDAQAKTQTFSNLIWPIVNGQTINGEFLAGRDPSGEYSDVDYYYFLASAGSSLTLSLNRSDTSLPWEHPDALDPQLFLVDPDGIVWEGFEVFDNEPGVDLNASFTNLVLPKAGRYIIYAATSKGFGAYQLAYSLAPAAPGTATQVIPVANNDRTVPLNASGLKPMALTLDLRGFPLSGAMMQFAATPEAGETGQISFPNGATTATSTRGLTQVDATLTTTGKISFDARLQEPGLTVPQHALVAEGRAAIPLYRPVGLVTQLEQGFDARTGELRVTQGRMRRLELGVGEMPAIGLKKNEKGRQPGSHIADPGQRPGSQSSAVSRKPAGMSPETITTCTPATFRAAGVNAAAVAGPFTVTLTDLTPKTGQSTGTEVIGVDGIHDHRVNKTIRIKIGIKDSNGVEPNYPVLVRLWLAGINPGMLILDPDGNRIECPAASFLWHERDAQGQIIALNEEFEYRLGTYSSFAGVKPDPQNPGGVLPVWGTSEVLDVFFGTFDDQTGSLTNQYSAVHAVHPEPGPPNHFLWNPIEPPPLHRLEYLAAYGATFGPETSTFTNGKAIENVYYLADQYDNKTYGFRTTSATDPAPNVNITFAAQDPGLTGVHPAGYELTAEWDDNPTGANPKTSSQWPNGEYTSTLTISGTDIEAGSFSISQQFTAVFSQPTFYSLVWADAYDPPYDLKFDFSVDPPVPITIVSPGAARTRLNGELSRNSILLVTGTRLGWSSVFPYWIGPPGSDPGIVDDGLDSFDVSLVDDQGKLVTDSEIQVAFCPVFQEPLLGPCPVGNQTSTDGVILGVRPIDRGYMGLMVSRAPTAPGVYFFRIKPVPSNVHQWRVGGSLDPHNNYTYTYAVTVVAAELLDENLQRTNKTLNFSIDRLFYFREVDLEEVADSYDVDLILEDQDTHLETTLSGVTVRRLGRSSIFMSDAISVISPDAPLQPLGQVQSIAAGRFGLLDIRSQAGTISARPGRYVVKDRRNRGETIVVTRIHLATTRLAEILDATPNFDGVTQGGPLGTATPARDRIEARVKWGADGYIATKLFNVDSDAIFTFDYWLEQPLTTDLRPGGLLISVEQGTQEQERIMPSSGQFKALVGSETVKPGLYRVRAKWGLNPGSASSTVLDDFCVTDRQQYDVCENEWIVSVGQRILLDAESSALASLGSNLSAVGDSRTATAFLDAVAAAATSKYAEASGNVVVTRDPGMVRPYLRHAIRDTMSSSACGSVAPGEPLYGCTPRGDFPLRDPNLDFAVSADAGINRDHIYRGLAPNPNEGTPDTTDFVYGEQLPQQPRNTAPMACDPVSNPCPAEVFFNRFVATVAHETAHGFGLASPTTYFVRGSPATAATVNCVAAFFVLGSHRAGDYEESPCGGDRLHEPVKGEWLTEPRAEGWLIQGFPFRWHLRPPDEGSYYDQVAPPQRWLVFDRPMWFSRSADYAGHGTDRSTEQFFKERIPLCEQGNRRCR